MGNLGSMAGIELERSLTTLPFVSEKTPLLNEAHTLRVRSILDKLNHGAIFLVEAQVDQLEGEVRAEIESTGDVVTITAAELRGIIARSAIRGSVQAMISTAQSLYEANACEAMLLLASPIGGQTMTPSHIQPSLFESDTA